jgi:hypothetical protein
MHAELTADRGSVSLAEEFRCPEKIASCCQWWANSEEPWGKSRSLRLLSNICRSKRLAS